MYIRIHFSTCKHKTHVMRSHDTEFFFVLAKNCVHIFLGPEDVDN